MRTPSSPHSIISFRPLSIATTLPQILHRVPYSNVWLSLREEREDNGGSSPNSGWTGKGPPMQIGTGYNSREFCDGQSLASPGRWPVPHRRFPSDLTWNMVSVKLMANAEINGPPRLLMDLALARIQESPFGSVNLATLKAEVSLRGDCTSNVQLRTERTSRLIIGFFSCYSQQRPIQKYTSVHLLRESVWVQGRGCPGCEREIHRKGNGRSQNKLTPTITVSCRQMPTRSGGETIPRWLSTQTKSSRLYLLLTDADDPEVHLGTFASEVRVCPGARLLPALHSPKRKWAPSANGPSRQHRARARRGRCVEDQLRYTRGARRQGK